MPNLERDRNKGFLGTDLTHLVAYSVACVAYSVAYEEELHSG